MYGLPDTFDATIFVGQTLLQVTFSENTVQLLFDGGTSVTIMSSFDVRTGESSEEQAIPVRSSSAMSLVGHAVTSAEGKRDGTLTLTLSGDTSITVHDDSEEYESYVIKVGDQEVYV